MLTPRQLEMAGLVAQGLTNKEIARQMGCSLSTVKHYVSAIMGLWDAKNRVQVALKYREGER